MTENAKLVGRSVLKLNALHKGIMLGHPPRARTEMAIFHAAASAWAPQNKLLADEMTLTPAGVLVLFKDEGIEKLITYAAISDLDLEPADDTEKRLAGEKESGKDKAKPRAPAITRPEGRIVAPEPVIANVRPEAVANVRQPQAKPRGAA